MEEFKNLELTGRTPSIHSKYLASYHKVEKNKILLTISKWERSMEFWNPIVSEVSVIQGGKYEPKYKEDSHLNIFHVLEFDDIDKPIIALITCFDLIGRFYITYEQGILVFKHNPDPKI
jgi:hypothetical protein